MRYNLVLILLLFISFSIYSEELEVSGLGDVCVIPFYSTTGDTYTADVVTSYLRNALIFIGDVLYDTPYVLKAMDWKGIKKGGKVSLDVAIEIGKKLEAEVIYFGDVKKESKSYTIHLVKVKVSTGEILFDKTKVADDLYLISRKIDEILGISPES
ncbi:MAG: hypothetical protein ACUVWP_01230 [bacterium]